MADLYYLEDYKPHLVVEWRGEVHILPIAMLADIANGKHEIDSDTMAAITAALLSYTEDDYADQH